MDASINWQFVIRWSVRLLSLISIVGSFAWLWYQPGFEPALALIGSIIAFIASFQIEGGVRASGGLPEDTHLYEPDCGDEAIDLADQRLLVSTAFGTYFAGLLERDQSYIHLPGQIECTAPSGQEALDPIQRIFWALQYPRGPRSVVIAAEGGMGKSTLASKLVRCLYQEKAIDLILGDSAKTQHADPVTGKLSRFDPGYYDAESFYERLSIQLGLPSVESGKEIETIKDRLEGRRAIIVLDNLESLSKVDRLNEALDAITNRDVRAIVTTRRANGSGVPAGASMMVLLKPIANEGVMGEFLAWHIQRYQIENPDLPKLRSDLDNKKYRHKMLDCTGGIPLLVQILLSDVTRLSWDYLDQLPNLYGNELLEFLYKDRWDELNNLGSGGLVARSLLQWIDGEQYRGKKVTIKRLARWAEDNKYVKDLSNALTLLHKRFLIVNHNQQMGHYAIFPSLSEFLKRHHAG